MGDIEKEKNYYSRALKFYRDIRDKDKTNFSLNYIINFMVEWDETVAMFKRKGE